jgi:hypothetical protein
MPRFKFNDYVNCIRRLNIYLQQQQQQKELI